jgi:hypothetical protein
MQTATDLVLQKVIAQQEIQDVIMLVARAIDRCDANLLRECFHPLGTDDHGSFKGTAEEFITWVIPVLEGMERTQHNICNVLVDVDGDTATSESYFVAHHRLQVDGKDKDMIAAGRYLDKWEKFFGMWKLKHRQAVYDWSKNEDSTDSWSNGMPEGMVRGARGKEDLVYAK